MDCLLHGSWKQNRVSYLWSCSFYRAGAKGVCKQNYRNVLEYGIELSDSCRRKPAEAEEKQEKDSRPLAVSTEERFYGTERSRKSGKKRVISAKDVEQLQRGGVLLVEEDDIITDLARDRARFLQVTFKTAGH